ncbi:MAG: NAD(P)H-dependent oxidoreductase [Candidatus Krumholzibacteriia bacterium]|nr:NAD(P)H-dependent oxidoreductase [bacterium]MCB9512700.1 NAD(P)H-dependent oxidoreductase [Candidatus Latescibacterota bacterium]MCB9516784.1 NAD(P)H-dependent oxidoreductase [Candidatus Latescibacterota bacterium]
MNLLIVSGSTRARSRTRALATGLVSVAETAGASVRLLDLHATRLPLFESGNADLAARPEVEEIKDSAAWADGFLLGTPEYHGGVSSALKNWLDYLYEELAGKLAGVYAVTGGGGGDMSITAVKNSVHWCHGFTLPFHAAARGVDFDGLALQNEKVRDRLERLVRDLVRYAPVLRSTFESARAQGKGPEAGFAGFHAD